MKKTGYVHIDGYDEISLEELKEIKDMGFKQVINDLWVDKTGSVLSIKEKYDKYWCKLASLSKNNNGYYQASCYSRKGAIPVHELVMLAFVGPRPEGMEIDHIDKNRVNNKLSNLRYLSISENRRQAKHDVPHKYLGRYCKATETFTHPDGRKIHMDIANYYCWIKTVNKVQAKRFYNKNKAEIEAFLA